MPTSITRWEPFAELAPMRDLMDRFFNDRWAPFHNVHQYAARPLAIDMYEAEGEVTVKAALPGFSEKDVDVTVEHDTLTIRASRPEANVNGNGNGNVRWVHREMWAGEYLRTIVLPRGLQADKAEATYADGVLTLRIPKAEAARPKRIKLQAKA